MTADHPPRPAATFTVAVTGHRTSALADVDEAELVRRIGDVLRAARGEAERLFTAEATLFTGGPPAFRFLSPLADGADRIAADAALEASYALHAILPFARADYADDFPDADERAAYARLLERAAAVLELPGARGQGGLAYAMAGRACVAHADLLLAVWDGEPARGRGGTAEVVETALRRGLPVVHLSARAGGEADVLWTGWDAHGAEHHHHDDVATRPFDRGALAELLPRLLAPSADPRQRANLRRFLAERERRVGRRLEYPLLLMLTGVKRLRREQFRMLSYEKGGADDWAPFHGGCGRGHGVALDVSALERAYCWADGLARHFAQSYRSGHVFNFAMGAMAVLLALASLVWAKGKVVLAVSEFAVILAVIANTRAATGAEWHRRWLDYRQLAERLRPMRSLALCGLARPSAARPDRGWVDWYADAAWRACGPPSGRLDSGGQAALSRALGAAEVDPQIAYNRASAAQAELLDHRLHKAGTALFALTLVGCVALLAGLAFAPVWTAAHADWFVIASAGLPALGTALFGIRVQGDFGGTAQRGHATAGRLAGPGAELAAGAALPRAASLLECAAQAMVADLDEWRQEHSKHAVALP